MVKAPLAGAQPANQPQPVLAGPAHDDDDAEV